LFIKQNYLQGIIYAFALWLQIDGIDINQQFVLSLKDKNSTNSNKSKSIHVNFAEDVPSKKTNLLLG